MGNIIFLGGTALFGALAFGAFTGVDASCLACVLPIAMAAAFLGLRITLSKGELRTGSQAFAPAAKKLGAMVAAQTIPAQFRVTKIGKGYVEFEHPEGGSWSYGLSEDIAAVNGVKMIESLGGWQYRMHVSRNADNAARVLEAAHSFRTGPKVMTGGAVYLNACPGYDVLLQEAACELD